jgi:hypothetical protein
VLKFSPSKQPFFSIPLLDFLASYINVNYIGEFNTLLYYFRFFDFLDKIDDVGRFWEVLEIEDLRIYALFKCNVSAKRSNKKQK